MQNKLSSESRYYRAVWISDVHLGSKACRAEFLLDFLNSIRCDYLYLVGDIIDLWAMQRSMYWPQLHNDVIRTILKMGDHGTKIIYVPGNHDGFMRDHEGMQFGAVIIQNEVIHKTADGRELLVLHGDQFDDAVKCGKIESFLGNNAYSFLIWLNRNVNYVRRKLGFPYWSLATYLKQRVKSAATYMNRFEKAVMVEAHRRGVDGLICGHVHRAEVRYVDGVLYCNDGDWVENCTALTETFDGTINLIHWADQKKMLKKADTDVRVAESKAA